GNDTYIVGTESSSGLTTAGKVWKNGVSSTLTDASKTNYLYGIAAIGTDVYVGGYERIGTTTKYIAKTWLNGQETKLSDGNSDCRIIGVFVK
ncbi:MAG: hypothetical protein WC622_16490, partial [Pedobacter sp.]|uniref:hypothetical protein n=1 Tax=Pedobacter sp. TaxID=1411316 RepID=UPI00356144FC